MLLKVVDVLILHLVTFIYVNDDDYHLQFFIIIYKCLLKGR